MRRGFPRLAHQRPPTRDLHGPVMAHMHSARIKMSTLKPNQLIFIDFISFIQVGTANATFIPEGRMQKGPSLSVKETGE